MSDSRLTITFAVQDLASRPLKWIDEFLRRHFIPDHPWRDRDTGRFVRRARDDA